MAEAFQLWRSDEVTVAGDALTARDLVSFAGLGPDKVMTLPGLVPAPDFGALPALLLLNSRLDAASTPMLWASRKARLPGA